MADAPRLRLYNTLTRTKEDFVPLDPANVRMYVCGPTVYDYAHIGNARPVIVFDVLFRLLRHLYGEQHVTYVRNITDIDDKINKRAFERWTKKRPLLDEVKALTEVTAAQYEADVKALGCLPPTHSPRATDFVCQSPPNPYDMVRVIEKLVARGHAYAAEGHVLFHVPSMPAYGRLSRRPLDEMVAGARVEVAPYKRDPMDFVLWKPSDPATEPGWDSPWGFGRPGWHIECSAMSGALLGEQFDIHAGGIDLIFPHHENEIAQSCCAFGVEKMASVWMHNGFLQVEGQKMSKSVGNFFTIQDVLNDWPGEVVRLNMLKTHYRQPIDWTVRGLEESRQRLYKWNSITSRAYKKSFDKNMMHEFVDALSDDLSTSYAIKLLDEAAGRSDYYDNGPETLKMMMRLIGFKPQRNPFEEAASGLERALRAIEQMGDFDVYNNKYRLDRFVNTHAGKTPPEVRFFGLIEILRRWKSSNNFDYAMSDELKFAVGNFMRERDRVNLEERIQNLVDGRLEARRAKNFAESDRIRDELLAMGIQLKDGKDSVTGEPVTTWEVKR